MKVLIIEDDLTLRLHLEVKLDELDLNIKFELDETDAISTINSVFFDLVILDYRLGQSESAGENIAKILNEKSIPFIFMTAYPDDFIFQKMLEYKPLAYFSKPIDYTALKFQIETFQNNFVINKMDWFSTNSGCIYVRHKSSLVKLILDEITHIEGKGNYITIFYKGQIKYAVRTSLKKFFNTIGNSNLKQAHRNYLVNINQISSIDTDNKQLHIVDSIIPISRSYKGELLKTLPLL